MRLTWMHRVSRTCMQEIGRWPSVIIATCCTILRLRRMSDAGCPVAEVACLCCFASGLRLNATVSSITKKSNIKRIYWRLCSVFMASRYSKLVCISSLCVVCSTTCFSPISSIIERMTVNLRFICGVTRWGYLLEGVTSNFSSSHHRTARVITCRLRVWGEGWSGLVCFFFDSWGLCVLLRFCFLKHHPSQDLV